jgi:hypothetical protein
MTKIFFSGSRRFTRLSRAVRERADAIVEKGFTILVGDADGADAAMQRYLARKGYERVIIFHTGSACRNNVGGWETRSVPPQAGARRGFRYYALKDEKMSEEADHGLVMWDGESKGTLNNILNLLSQGKSVVVYLALTRELHRLKTRHDLASLLAGSGNVPLEELEEQLRVKKGKTSREKQLTLT